MVKKAKAKKPATKKPSKEARSELEREKISELIQARHEFMEALAVADEAKAHAGETRKTAETKQARMNAIVWDLEQIRAGNYQPTLPFTAVATGPDAGADMPLAALGLPAKKTESLADAIGGSTVGHLEKFQRENQTWNRDLKGFGEEWITKLQDAHEAFRRQHPMPETPVTVVGEINKTFASTGEAASAIVDHARESLRAAK